jgi:hypothetical protein
MNLVNDLIEAIEPYDVTMSSWLRLRTQLPVSKASVETYELDKAMCAYLHEQTLWLRLKNGSVEMDHVMSQLRGQSLQRALIQAGQLHPSDIVDGLIVYAAHLAAGTSYGQAAWDRILTAIWGFKISNDEKEMSRR